MKRSATAQRAPYESLKEPRLRDPRAINPSAKVKEGHHTTEKASAARTHAQKRSRRHSKKEGEPKGGEAKIDRQRKSVSPWSGCHLSQKTKFWGPLVERPKWEGQHEKDPTASVHQQTARKTAS